MPNSNEPFIKDVIRNIESSIPATEIIIANDRDRNGKGWAMREALSQAGGSRIVFLDGDMDIEPRMIKRLLPFLCDYDIVLGSKNMRNAPLHRKIITHLSRLYIRILFGIPWDTQTGLKLFRRDALVGWDTDDFAFTLEIIRLAVKRKLKIIEVPIEASITASMSWKAVWRTFISSLKIRFLM